MLQGPVGGEKILVQPRELPVWTHSPVVDVATKVATKEDDAEVIVLFLTEVTTSILTVVAPVILHSTTKPRIGDDFTLVSCQGDGRAFDDLVSPGQDICGKYERVAHTHFTPPSWRLGPGLLQAPDQKLWGVPLRRCGSSKDRQNLPANDMISPCILYPTI